MTHRSAALTPGPTGPGDPAARPHTPTSAPIDAPASAPGPVRSVLHRFVDGRTRPQRLVMTLGALAGALLAIGAATTAGVRLVRDAADRPSVGRDGVTQVVSGSAGADEFVRWLLDHDGGTPVQLDHQLLAKPGPGNVTLDYACAAASGCSRVRIEDAQVTFDAIEGGIWFQGCYAVTKDGAGYGARDLDIELRTVGATCPES